MKKSINLIFSVAVLCVMFAWFMAACNKENKETEQTGAFAAQLKPQRGFTLQEMADAMSREKGITFIESQSVKDYSEVCQKVMDRLGGTEKPYNPSQYEISWHWPIAEGGCDEDYLGICLIIKTDTTIVVDNAIGYFEDNKFVIVPTTDENGFTADGFLAVGRPMEVINDTIVIREGVYAAYYNKVLKKYTAVAVDYDVVH